ncbi:probable proline--tRNA ligase, mitochondrial [Ceratina calcarata]|uniref:proline--tRNA ligase n=1 Tax=Ceratina calcarata TaxID=156304 RepID=A0AAJ7NDD1_9HYME|nr:probable proline--tRNA ligase, mitochondrial [Ceratina calcarata]
MSNVSGRNIARLSRIFQPIIAHIATTKKTEVPSKSYKNLIKYGMMKQVNSGMYAFLPMGLRVLNKLTAIVDKEMEKIGAQKMLLPALTSRDLWEKTDRLRENISELFHVKDRSNKHYILSPTYEETICNLMSTVGVLSSKTFPVRLYQVSTKWRDEMKPRLGFLRSKEFLMKDLYTFDTNISEAQETYTSVCEAYDNIFKKLGIQFMKAIGDPGSIGGSLSHEYHYTCNIGEDTLCICSSCEYAINKTMCNQSQCPKCNGDFREENTSEVGHTFLLDTKFTKPLNVTQKLKNESIPLAMGSYGLGLSRIFTVATEILSTEEELRFPKAIAPYTVCVILPKKGSKEETGSQYLNEIIETLDRLNIDFVLDDRTNLTIGNRLMHSRVSGFPYAIVIGKSTIRSPPLIEVHDIYDSTSYELPTEDIPNYFNDRAMKI